VSLNARCRGGPNPRLIYSGFHLLHTWCDECVSGVYAQGRHQVTDEASSHMHDAESQLTRCQQKQNMDGVVELQQQQQQQQQQQHTSRQGEQVLHPVLLQCIHAVALVCASVITLAWHRLKKVACPSLPHDASLVTHSGSCGRPSHSSCLPGGSRDGHVPGSQAPQTCQGSLWMNKRASSAPDIVALQTAAAALSSEHQARLSQVRPVPGEEPWWPVPS